MLPPEISEISLAISKKPLDFILKLKFYLANKDLSAVKSTDVSSGIYVLYLWNGLALRWKNSQAKFHF